MPSSLAHKTTRKILGLMSGTSLDGVDLALANIQGSGRESLVHTEKWVTIPYPDSLKERIRQQMIPESSRVDSWCVLNVELGQFFGEIILQQLETWKVEPAEVDAIGSHGHTLYHQPNGRRWDGKNLCATLQIGDGDSIAFRTGILTISDFRAKDVAAGGSGAPLLPYVDFLLFERKGEPKLLHNLGGMSNVTWLSGSGNSEEVLAFDTGPANVLINLATEHFFGKSFDAGGEYAAQGTIHSELLKECLAHPFFQRALPKSTGREMFGETFCTQVFEKAKLLKLSAFEVLATLTALTAHSITEAYHRYLPQIPQQTYFSGGGVHNRTLMRHIQTLLPQTEMLGFSELGMNEEAREALSFAVLANEHIAGNAVSFKGITGNSHQVILGKSSSY